MDNAVNHFAQIPDSAGNQVPEASEETMEIPFDDRPESPVISNFHPNEFANEVVIDERSRSPILPVVTNWSDVLATRPVGSPTNSEETVPLSDPPTPVLNLEYSQSPFEPEYNENEQPSTSKQKDNSCDCNCHSASKRRTINDDDDEEGKLCPICFDGWTNSGEHRLCSLNCGHLFGFSCVERWLNTQKTCPTCKSAVRKSEIRFIYARRLIALDTSVLNALNVQLNNTLSEKNRLQIQLAQSLTREHTLNREICELQAQLTVLRNRNNVDNNAVFPGTSNSFSQSSFKIYRDTFFDISNNGGCRVMDFYKNSSLLVVSAQSPSPLFAGYGVKKIPLIDPRASVFIPLHSQTIRDIAFHPHAELLLSASIDKCVRLTETNNNKSVHTFQCGGPIWSCCWDIKNPSYFFVGEQSGDVVKYDMRKTNEKLRVLKVPGDYSPVVSLATTGWNPDMSSPQYSVIVCKLNSCSLFIDCNSNIPELNLNQNHYPLGLTGPFVSMRYCNVTNHLLVSSRPNSQTPFSKHTVSTLSLSRLADGCGTIINCNSVQSFQGAPMQKLLSRSCLLNMAGDMFAAAHNESQKCVEIWSVSSGVKKNVVKLNAPVLDLCHIETNCGSYLAALNEKKVDLFKIDFS